MHPVYKKELQIIGQIGEPGQRDKLNFTSLDRQIHRTCKRGYDEGEIVEAVSLVQAMDLRQRILSASENVKTGLKYKSRINPESVFTDSPDWPK